MSRFSLLILGFLVASPLVLAEGQMTIEDFLSEVKERNLDLKIERSLLEKARANAIGINLAPPMAGFSHLWPKSGGGVHGFEISQSIPFPTKIIADKKIRNREVDSFRELALANKIGILTSAKLAYISYWVAVQKIDVLSSRKNNLLDHLKLARAGARSDSSMKIHLLRAESDIDLLENEMEEAKQNLIEQKNELALYLGKVDASEIEAPAEPRLSEMKTLSKESYQLKAAKAQFHVFETKAFEAKQTWLPDFLVRYKQMTATPTMEGYREIMVGVTLPFLFPWAPYRESRKASEDHMQFEYRYQKAKIEFEAAKMNLSNRARSYRTQLENLINKTLPRAEKRMTLVHAIAPRDMESLQDHRETLEAFTDLRLKILNLRFAYEKTIAELEKVDGGIDEIDR